MHELDAGAIGFDSQVDVVMYGRYVAVDTGLGIRSVVGYSMYVNLLRFVVPVGKGMQHTHPSAFKLKFIYGQVGIGLELVKERPGACLTGSFSAELNAVKVYQVEDISHLYFA